MRRDVLVVGAGPAGMALAAACCNTGLDVAVVAPMHGRAWTNTYGVWIDEAGVGDHLLRARWERPYVGLDRGAVALDRPYGLLDNEALRRALQGSGYRAVTGTVRGLRFSSDRLVASLDGGEEVAAGAVVDATGASSTLVSRPPGRPPAWQVAYGIVATFAGPAIPAGSMALMDWRTPLADRDVERVPSFLYAMDLGEGRIFVEETSLAARPPVRLEALRTRLTRRLEAGGTPPTSVLTEEQVRFPMGGPLPARDQPVIAFGAAAGMVHPATGYSVGAALRRAPTVAAALASALGAAGATTASVARAGWAAVWPDDLVRQRALHSYGLETLLGMDRTTLQAFFEAFFSLPRDRWVGYLSGAPSSGSLAATMLEVFRRAAPPLRRRLLVEGLQHPREWLAALR
jgi:lycopene cyclase-like protein